MNKVRKKEIRNFIGRVPCSKKVYRYLKNKKKKNYNPCDSVVLDYDLGIDEDISLNGADEVIIDWPKDIQKPYVGLVKDSDISAYWPKYERFLKNNDIGYDFYDIHNSDFLEEAKKYDVIVWRTSSDPAEQEEARSKIRILEKELEKICIPSVDELWFYENKINQYYLCRVNDLPIINTFISNSKEEAIEYINNCTYPIVSKITTGAGSQGVKLLKSYKKAKNMCIKIFDEGLHTYWSYIKQKNYVYFQDFIPDAQYDLRVIIVANSYFGYYRMVPKDDFRASGSGREKFGSIPVEALLLAKKVKESFPQSRILAVDLLKDVTDDKFYIIETSIFYRIDFPSETIVDGKLGRYIYKDNKFIFEEGKFWTQELVLSEVMNEWLVLNMENKNDR